ncbi:unnamed protein product [Caenorhabditis brenneri]
MDGNLSNCQVCHHEARGKRHYGAVVCRACAAFFRRAVSSKKPKTCCKKKNKCEFLKDGFFTCKYCRLQKCFRVGMTSENFQFDRDGYQVARFNAQKIPLSMDTFCGRSNLIIFQAPSPSDSKLKPYINLQFLMDQISKILVEGPSTPLTSKTKLGKLALSLRGIQEKTRIPDPTKIDVYGREDALRQMEYDILSVTKWLTHFEDFQLLPQGLQTKMLQGIWHIWWKLERVAYTARKIKAKIESGEIPKNLDRDSLIFEWEPERIDLSWCSKYTTRELKFFVDIPTEIRLDTLTRAMIQLSPTDTELSFMLGQLCFHYVGKRFQGEILQVSDRFQQILADDLHDYYVNQMKQPYYIKRSKARKELAIVFDMFHLDVSHPEMFIEV